MFFENIDHKLHWIVEDAYIQEIGKIRSELGEIGKIYADYDALLEKLWFLGSEDENVKKAEAHLKKGLQIVGAVENDLHQLTKTGKEPVRSPIKQLELSGDLEKDKERLSDNFARLAVRIRNVGQTLESLSNIDMKSVVSRLEKAYLIVRRAFVLFDRIVRS